MPNSLKILIGLNIALSLLGALVPGLFGLLALSWVGVKKIFLWQFFTYTFVERPPLSWGFFIQLGFNMYLLWMFGVSLLERVKTTSFMGLYFGSVFVSGLTALIFPQFLLSGSLNAIYAILIAWMILNPYSQLLLFFALPFKSYFLILGLIGISLLLDLTSANFLAASTLISSCIFSYIYSLIAWRTHSPVEFLHPFERKFFHFLEKKEEIYYKNSKIFDIKSGKQLLDDDQFMDAMLDRIARHGEESLTRAERKRMREISNRKKR